MAVINNSDLREIAYRIISEPGFSTDGQGLLRAHQRWIELTEPDERLAVERALFSRWLQDLRAERDRPPLRFSIPDARDPRPLVVPAKVESDGDAPAYPVLKFRSESPDWQRRDTAAAADDLPGGQLTRGAQSQPAAGEQVPVPAALEAVSKAPPPVRAQRDAPRTPAPVTVTSIVQQPSRKVASYQHMFPELAFPVQTASGAKPLAEFGPQDIDYRIGRIQEQRQAWRTANAGDEARIEQREHLNARDRVRIAERGQNIHDAQAEEERLATAKRELADSGCAVIGELAPEVLAACGFKRRVA